MGPERALKIGSFICKNTNMIYVYKKCTHGFASVWILGNFHVQHYMSGWHWHFGCVCLHWRRVEVVEVRLLPLLRVYVWPWKKLEFISYMVRWRLYSILLSKFSSSLFLLGRALGSRGTRQKIIILFLCHHYYSKVVFLYIWNK